MPTTMLVVCTTSFLPLHAVVLRRYMTEELLEGMEMFPGFVSPPNALNHKQVC